MSIYKPLSAFALIVVAILLVLLFNLALPGCTGEQLAPGGNVRFMFNLDANHPSLTWSSNKDITADTLDVTIPGGATFKATNLNSNSSTLGAIQGTASAAQLYYWNLGFSQGVNGILSALGKAQVAQGGQVITITPATQPAK